jgi:hypothetical protein
MSASNAVDAGRYTRKRGLFACLMAAKWAIIQRIIAFSMRPPGCYARSAARGRALNTLILWLRRGARKLARYFEKRC